jgi:pimeloyl-[acyl-carrier protein] methyl ester esterase
MPMNLLFCHGWAFDAGMWDPLAALIGEFAQARDDAGYFGHPASPVPSQPIVAVTHSFGTMRLLAAPPPGLVGIVAISGFDRFSATDGFPGQPARVFDRMIGAFAQEPETVLADFRARCGSAAAIPAFQPELLMRDLGVLRDGDLRETVAELGLPILSLQSERDPLLTLGMRESVFASAASVMRRTHPTGGHLLPIDQPDWCANAIRTFAKTLG